MSQSETNSQTVLSDEILSDARRQAERTIRKAKRDGQAMIDKASTESQESRDETLTAAREEADAKRTLILAALPIEIGRLRAARIEQELMSLREIVRLKLETRDGFDYVETLAALAAEAISKMSGDAFLLGLSEADRKSFGPSLVDKTSARVGRPNVSVTIDPQPSNIQGGVVVRDSEGRQIWDNSLSARLDRIWPSLRSQLAEHLKLQASVESSGEAS